jgi:hypothetical protein
MVISPAFVGWGFLWPSSWAGALRRMDLDLDPDPYYVPVLMGASMLASQN